MSATGSFCVSGVGGAPPALKSRPNTWFPVAQNIPEMNLFNKLPPAQLNALLADKAALIKVLTYHVVPGEIVAADVKAGPLKTVEGESLNVTTSSMGVKVNDANVIKTDVMASNGVIHVIDTVVVPN